MYKKQNKTKLINTLKKQKTMYNIKNTMHKTKQNNV